ncbi:UNKNOWN [Stylonychia lemnae]|uniref:Transmembrane channel-like protein 7 n=1 Tax=Stylonychia lemnae TaxID=5949 RepID=A0A078B740_STYLE|nr:UNKNOWN [Stylonychia lemnae]|eukprot:CDW90011.1 UNKNOWN [Stylonychia lemnae]
MQSFGRNGGQTQIYPQQSNALDAISQLQQVQMSQNAAPIRNNDITLNPTPNQNRQSYTRVLSENQILKNKLQKLKQETKITKAAENRLNNNNSLQGLDTKRSKQNLLGMLLDSKAANFIKSLANNPIQSSRTHQTLKQDDTFITETNQTDNSQPIGFVGTKQQMQLDEMQSQKSKMDAYSNVDHKIVEKIRELRSEYEKKQEEALREQAINDVKVEAMAKKILDMDKAKSDAIQRYKDEILAKQEVQQKVQELKEYIQELEEQLEDAKSKITQQNPMISQIKTVTEREAINQQLEKEREQMRQELNKGLEHIDDGGGYENLGNKKRKEGCWHETEKQVLKIWRKFSPLSQRLAKISRTNERSIVAYFTFVRFIFLLSLLQVLVFTYLIVNHVARTDNFKSICVFKFVPCFMLYSSFEDDEALGYSITLVISLTLSVILCLSYLISQDKTRRIKSQYMNDGTKKFTKLIFNAIEWNIRDRSKKVDIKTQISMEMKNLLKEDEVKKAIASRTKQEKFKLFLRRLISFLVNIAVIGGGWYAIYTVNVRQDEIETKLVDFQSWLKYVADFVAPLCLSFINIILPSITNQLIQLEKWDFQSTVIINEILRNFLTKQFNIILFFLLNIDMLFPETLISSEDIIKFKASTYPCAEIQISINFIRVVATELVIFILKHPVKFCVHKLKNICKQNAKYDRPYDETFTEKPRIKVSEFIVWTLYITTVLWLCPMFSPLFQWVIPLFLYLIFYYSLLCIKMFYQKSSQSGAQSAEDNTTYLIFIFVNFVFLGIVNGAYGYFLFRQMNHTCGAFVNYYAAIYPLFDKSTVVYHIMDLLTFPPILIALIFLFLGLALINRNKSQVIAQFIESKEREYQLLVFDLQKRIDNLKKRQNFMLGKAEKSRKDSAPTLLTAGDMTNRLETFR